MAACKKENSPQNELSKLPAATQSGANTFGCLVNGKAWVAQTDCKYLCDPAFKIYYDAGSGGNLFITTVYQDSKNSIKQDIVMSMDSTNTIKLFNIAQRGKAHMGFSFINEMIAGDCYSIHSIDSLIVTATGSVNLSKYDLQNGIISGTFEFYLTKPNCDPISAANGRFDYKLF